MRPSISYLFRILFNGYMYYIVFQWGICVLGELGWTIMSVFQIHENRFFFFCGVILGICSTQMVPRYAFTIDSMDYSQSIMLGLKVLKWMFAP